MDTLGDCIAKYQEFREAVRMGTVRTGHGLHLAFHVIEQSKQNIETHQYQSVISGMAKPVLQISRIMLDFSHTTDTL